MRRGVGIALLLFLVVPSAAGATGPQTFPLTAGGGGGGGAPDDATYVLQVSDGDLPNAQDLDSLTAGLLLNDSSGILSAYAGSSCSAGQAPRGLGADGTVANCTAFLTAEVDGSTTNEIQNLFETINASSGTDPVADSSTDTLNLTGTAPVTVTGDSSTDTLTFSLADVTDCSANQFVTGSGANLSLVCAQPSAANLSNGTTGSGAVVLTNGPTIVTPTIASFVNATHDHSNSAGGGQITHADLGSKGADDHTQYLLLDGRSGGQIAYGGTASGDDLTLHSTSHGTKGSLILDDNVELWPTVPDIAASTATQNVVSFNADVDVSGVASTFRILGLAPTVHIGQASSLLTTIGAVVTQGMTIAHDDATATTGNLPFSQLFWAGHKILTTVAVGAPSNFTLLDGTAIQASGAITVPSGNGQFMSSRIMPSISAISGATFTYPEVTGIYFNPSLSTDNAASDGTAVTVTNMYGARFRDWSNSGGDGTESVGTYVAVDIEALANSTVNIGFRNADTTVFTPPSTVTLAAAFTLTATATTQKVNATANRTSDTTTAITDGVADGQEFVIMNVDAEGQTITIKNAANTDLGADCTLNQGGTLTVMWSSDRSDWLSKGCLAN